MSFWPLLLSLLPLASADSGDHCSDLRDHRMVAWEALPGMPLQNEIPPLDEVLVSFGAASKKVIPARQTVTMVVWNIFKAKRPQLLSDLISFGRISQFLVIQENLLNRRVTSALSAMPGYGWENALSFYQRNGDGTGVATGSVYAPVRVGFLRSPGREPITNTPKMALITEYAVEGSDQTLVVANLHALNFVPNFKFKEQLDELALNLRRHQGPLIVTGDFNTHHHDRYLIMAKMAESIGLRLQPLRNDRRLFKLDHVMVRGVDVVDAEVITAVSSSDHLPVRIRFQL